MAVRSERRRELERRLAERLGQEVATMLVDELPPWELWSRLATRDDFDELRRDVGVLKDDIGVLKQDVAGLHTELDVKLARQQTQLHRDMTSQLKALIFGVPAMLAGLFIVVAFFVELLLLD